MTTKRRFLTALIALILMVTGFFAVERFGGFDVSAAVDTSKDKEADLKAQLKSAQNQQAELKKKLENAKSGIEDTENRKEYLDSLVSATQTEIDVTEQLIAEYDEKITAKTAEIDEMQASIDTKFDQMMERLRFSYEEGTASYLEMILSSESLTEALSGIDRVGSMMDFDQSLMQELSDNLKALQGEKTVLEGTKKEQEELKVTLEGKVTSLEDQIKEANEYIVKLRADEESYQAEYEKAKAAEKEANAEIEKILEERRRIENAKLNDDTNTTGGSGSSALTGSANFIWPVDASFSRISSAYGGRILWGRYDFHLGIDIPASYGRNVYASHSGTVVVATYHYSYGNYIVIDHGGGYSTLYGHNSKLCVKVGDKVSQGQVIAKIGSTGSSSGPHCHFEVRINGKTQQPLNYVKRP